MGIYDRDYVRREGPSFLGSFVERGRVCRWLVGINVAVFIVQILTLPTGRDDDPGMGLFTNAFVLNVDGVQHGQVWRLLTYAFLHDPSNVFHILFNMLFLWWFGSDVEDLYGPREFLAFYLTAAFVAGVAFFLSSLAWMPTAAPCLGASGAVNAALVLCAIHYPRRIIYLFFFLPVPIWLFIAVVLAGDAFVFLHQANSGVAVAAHLGGALFAGIYYHQNWRLTNWWPNLRGWRPRLFRPRLRVYREEDTAPAPPEKLVVRVPAAPAEDEQLEAKMDAILEKISRVGKENLTETERQLLLRASEIYRRRRT